MHLSLQVLLVARCLLVLLPLTRASQVAVIDASNVPYPKGAESIAHINVTLDHDPADHTYCFRYKMAGLFEGVTTLIRLRDNWNEPLWGDYHDLLIGPGYKTGQGCITEGLMPFNFIFNTNVDSSTKALGMPAWNRVCLPIEQKILRWYSMCYAISTSQKRQLAYINGHLTFSFHHQGDIKHFPRKLFQNIILLKEKFRGWFSDFNIFPRFFDHSEMKKWTTSCNKKDKQAKIFDWDKDITLLNYTKEALGIFNISTIFIDRSDLCPLPQEDLFTLKEQVVFEVSTDNNATAINQTSWEDMRIEIFNDAQSPKSPLMAWDRCLRLNGELVPLPQNKAEEMALDNAIKKYLKEKYFNNMTFVVENMKWQYTMVAAQTMSGPRFDKEMARKQGVKIEDREAWFPPDGKVDYYHPLTKQPLVEYRKNLMSPFIHTFYKYPQQCLVCRNSYDKVNGNREFWAWFPYKNDLRMLCFNEPCEREDVAWAANACIFKSEPLFTLRGLCSSTNLDTKFILMDHKSDGGNHRRRYAGLTGWIIEYNANLDQWKMEHENLAESGAVMVDKDVLPVGRHVWRLEKSLCHQGRTVEADLLITGCRSNQFTCNDGKCVGTEQRCNNIEVGAERIPRHLSKILNMHM